MLKEYDENRKFIDEVLIINRLLRYHFSLL